MRILDKGKKRWAAARYVHKRFCIWMRADIRHNVELNRARIAENLEKKLGNNFSSTKNNVILQE